MIKSKYTNIIIVVAVIFALVAVLLLLGYSNSEIANAGVTQQYQTKLFGGEIIDIDIIADQSDWDTMLENAISEEYIMVDVVINGTKFQNVGIRPKGNSSLTQVANNDTTDRFSFRLKFDQYIEGQTCFGLNTFVVNNMLGDSSYMKEYFSYDIMNYIGVDTPLYDFADISVNGEVWGFYLAIEAYDDSYLSRVYGDTSGNLYNVKSMDMGNKNDNQMQNGGQMPDRPDGGQMPAPFNIQDGQANENVPNLDSQTQDENRGNFKGGGMGGRGSSGGDLQYSDDSTSSYSAIFNNAIGKTTEVDQQRVITALKNLSTGTELEKYFDVDKILRYMAAHTFVVNLDSYSSNLAQNYYIYENDGKITILPWDYNYSFGGFQSGNASSVVNFPIDTPVSGVNLEDRPLFEKLLANQTYKVKYHEYLDEIVTGYFADGKWAEKIEQLDSLIASYVENDPTAFCTYEEYQKALSALTSLGELRAESIMGQLKGTVPSTTEGQSENSGALISADSLTLSDLGNGMGGGGRGNWGGQDPNNNQDGQERPGGGFGNMGEMPDMATMQKVMEIIQSAQGNSLTEEQIKQLTELGLTEDQITALQSMGNPFDGGAPNGNFQRPDGNMGGPNGNTGNQTNPFQNTGKGNFKNIIIMAGLVVLLILDTVFVSKFRKNY